MKYSEMYCNYSDIFFKKNVLIIQAVIIFFISELESFFKFNNCLELEKEIEELKSKPGEADDIIKVMKQL